MRLMTHKFIAAQGVIGLEIIEQLPDVDEIYVPIRWWWISSRCFGCYQR